MAENSILIDEEQDKENSLPPHPTTPVSESPIQPPVWMRKCPLGTRIEKVPLYVSKNLFKWIILLLQCMYFNENYN